MQRSGLEEPFGIWNRRKWLALGAFTASFTLLASLVAFLPDTYQASVTLLVESQQVPEEFVRSTVSSAVERRLHTIGQAIVSRSRLDGLIENFGLYGDLKTRLSPQEVTEQMRDDIAIELKPFDQRGGANSTVAFQVGYRGSDPNKVAAVANAIASFYIEEDLKNRERQAGGTTEFLSSQLEEMKKKLDLQEKQVSEYKEKHIGELPEQRDANLATLERVNSQLLLNSEKQIRAREQKGIFEKQLAGAESPTESSRPDAAIARIAKLNAELADLRRTYSDKYPDVIRLKQEIDRVQRQIEGSQKGDAEEYPTLDPYVLQIRQAIRSADAEVRVLAADEANLRHTIALYQERVENAPRREQEFQELSRDYRTTQDIYSSLLKRYEEAKLAESMEHRQKGEQFRILDPAVTPDRPSAPNRPRLIGFGLAFSVALAAGLAMIAERLDTSFHDVDALRAFSKVPVLASIPRIITADDRRRSQQRFRAALVSSAIAFAAIVGGSYVVAHGNERLVGLLSGSSTIRTR